MVSSYMRLPYALGVGVMLIDPQGRVLVGRLPPACAQVDLDDCWQMPQGRLASAEPPCEGAFRMLEDVTGVRGAQVLAEAPGWFSFELPPNLMGLGLQGRYCGQRQKWVAMRLLADDRDHSSNGGMSSPARETWRWVQPAEALRLAPSLKRELYEDVIATFAPFLRESCPQNGRLYDQPAHELPWFLGPTR